MPKITHLDSDSVPAEEILAVSNGPALRIHQEGSGNAIEVVNIAGAVVWSLSKDGTPSSGGSGGGSIAVASTLAGLNAAAGTPSDGQLGLIRVGTWPDIHEELLKWNAAAGKWVGEPLVLVTQNDSWAMDLANRSGTQLLDWSYINNPVSYGRPLSFTVGSQSAAAATINVSAVAGHGLTFPTAGTLQIRDNFISYTGVSGAQTAAFSFTGCSLLQGTGGTIPANVIVTASYVGGWGMVETPIAFASDLWTAGLRLQERFMALMNGSPETGKALTVAPYWHESNSGDGVPVPATTAAPTGGIGFSASLVGTTTTAVRGSERTFYRAENAWATWSAGTPTKRFLSPRIYGKMAAASVESGEVLDTRLSVRWIG